MTQDEIQAVARALAKAERLDWDEVCPLEHDDNAECNSSTCIAAHDEDHDPEWGRKIMLIKAQASIAALDAARGDAEPAMTQKLSILAQARRDAVREYQSQISQLADDDIKDAYRRGRYDGRVQGHISEGRWWCFGVMCGVVLSVLVWSFWP